MVDALAGTFAGDATEKKYTSAELTEEVKQEKLPAEFRDNTSTEQKKLLKTYNDLVSVAE